MKKIYKKPIIEIVELLDNVNLMSNSDKEPEITENIGAKENNFEIEDEDILTYQTTKNLWENE